MRINWFDYEKKLMQRLGFVPTPGSGNHWERPEDGENVRQVAQLKSTKNQSISLKKRDIEQLTYNASVAHKVPVFVVSIDGLVLVCVRPEHLASLSNLIDVS